MKDRGSKVRMVQGDDRGVLNEDWWGLTKTVEGVQRED
jgi:hypothetical protein